MKSNNVKESKTKEPRSTFEEGIHYYFEDGLMVLTAQFLRERGFCCNNGCRNCPYPKDNKSQL